MVRAVPSGSIAPETLIVIEAAAANLAAFCESVNPPPGCRAAAATVAADADAAAFATPDDPPDVDDDVVPVGVGIVGKAVEIVFPDVEIVGMLTLGAPETGMVGMLGNSGIELYF